MRVAVWNICYLDIKPSDLPDNLAYAHSLEVSGGDLYRDKSFLSDDHLRASELINEESSDSMSFYYSKVRGSDNLDWGSLLFIQNPFGRKSEETVSMPYI